MGRRSWLSKKNSGMLLGALAVAVILYYFYGTKATGPGAHANPRVGRGYGATPYGSPAGNPGRLTFLQGGAKQGCACHGNA